MPHILVRQHVEDYAGWKEAFDGDAAIRKAGGSRGGYVFQSVDDPNEVFILLEWDTMENLHQFAQSDELKERMRRAGVTGPPDIHFIHLADNPPR